MSQKIRVSVVIEVEHKKGTPISDDELRLTAKAALFTHLQKVLPWEINTQAVMVDLHDKPIAGSGELGTYVFSVREIIDARASLTLHTGQKKDN